MFLVYLRSVLCVLRYLWLWSWDTWDMLIYFKRIFIQLTLLKMKEQPGHEAWHDVCWYSQWESPGEQWFFLCCWVSMTHSFLVRGGSLYPLPSLSTGTHSILNLCRPCARNLHLLGQWVVWDPKHRWKQRQLQFMGLCSAAFSYYRSPSVCLHPASVTLCFFTLCFSSQVVSLSTYHPVTFFLRNYVARGSYLFLQWILFLIWVHMCTRALL